ncbi:MAG: 50S ribosomal protein L10 [Candidatus Dormibacteria bacterium]
MAKSAAPPSGSRAGPRKHEAVATLTDKLSRATSAVITDYRGLTVAQLEELRAQLRERGVDYVVVKNTLARRAAEAAGKAPLSDVLVGPVGLALGYDDLAAPAKVLSEYFRVTKRLPSVAGFVEGTVLDADGVKMLAELPSRDNLLAQLAGTLQSPLAQLAGSLDAVTSIFAATLEAYRDKLAAAA